VSVAPFEIPPSAVITMMVAVVWGNTCHTPPGPDGVGTVKVIELSRQLSILKMA